MTVELGIPSEAQLVPGMEPSNGRYGAPLSACLFPAAPWLLDLQRTFVVRVKDGKVEWIDVKTGMTAGNLLEVFGQLSPNDLVAVRGTDELNPKTQVLVKTQYHEAADLAGCSPASRPPSKRLGRARHPIPHPI